MVIGREGQYEWSREERDVGLMFIYIGVNRVWRGVGRVLFRDSFVSQSSY